MDIEDIKTAYAELESAKAALVEAEERTRAARSEETIAVNRLNKAQKAIDDLQIEMRKAAPRQSTWGSARKGHFDVIAELPSSQA
jgi:uncharacterized membrane protein (DUF106 family)